MIMVRRNELACRDEWSHDLWAPLGQEASAPAAAPAMDGAMDRFRERREPPATPAEIAAVVQSRSASAGGGDSGRVHEDVVVGETLVIAESERDWTWQNDDAAASRLVDTRAAIIKARETYRDRAKTLGGGRPNERPTLTEGGEVASAVAGDRTHDDANEVRSTIATSPTVRPPEPSLRLSRPVRDRDDDAVPAVDPEFDLAPVARRQMAPDPAKSDAGTRSVVPGKEQEEEVDRTAEVDGRAARTVPPDRMGAESPVALTSIRRITGSVRVRDEDRGRGVDRRPPEPSLVPVPRERTAGAPSSRGSTVKAVPELDLPMERREEASSLLHGRRRPFRFDPPPVPAHEVAERWGTIAGDDQSFVADSVAAGAPPRAEPALRAESLSLPEAVEPVEDVVVQTHRDDRDDPVDLTIRVAPDLPRTCRMCRDYRPAEGGGRGWCANEWAFTHRRVVDPDERMPCETTLGSWWLPVDAIWLSRTDVSSHGQPTPILDAVVAHHRSEPLRRGGS